MKRLGWYKVALEAIERIALRQRFMTSDTLWEEVPFDPPHPNGVGAVMREAQVNGTIRTTGSIAHTIRPNGRGRMIQIWESCVYQSPNPSDELAEFIAECERKSTVDPNQGSLSI